MSAQHTPAPWLIGEDQCVDETWSIVTTSGGSIIANVNDRHDRQANARLIAAAPDLLAALELFVAYDAAEDKDGAEEFPLMLLAYARALAAAKAAIAKARGQ